MSLELILIIILVIFLLGGIQWPLWRLRLWLRPRRRHVIGIILIVLVVLVLMGRL